MLIGLLAGYHGGWVDDLLMRIIDALYSFPALLLALAITAILGPGLTNVMLGDRHRVHASVRQTGARPGAVGARARFRHGRARDRAQPWRIMSVHIWPNVTAPIIVQASLQVAAAIVIEAGLSFSGAGRPAADAQLGSRCSKKATSTWSRRRGSPLRLAPPSSSPCSPSTCSATACATRSTLASAVGG